MITRLKKKLARIIELFRAIGRIETKLDFVTRDMEITREAVQNNAIDVKTIQKRLMRIEAQGASDLSVRIGEVELTPSPVRELSIDEVFDDLKREVPAAFEQWIKLVDVNGDTFEGYPVHSCAVKGHPVGHYFYYYCKPQLTGRVLDIGCGPQPIPFYLKDYPVELISGIDPLPAVEGHPFQFVRGLAETLPWEDDSFSTVILATSLDHILLIDRAYDEIARVLKPGGKVLMWNAFVKEAAIYDPYDPGIKPVDDYHLFHFTKQGFEDSISDTFFVEDVTRFENEIDHYFYSLSPYLSK